MTSGTSRARATPETDAALLTKHFGGGYKPEHFTGLDNFTVCVKQQVSGISQDPFLGFTHLFETPAYLGERKVRYLNPADIVRISRRHYAERRSEVDAKIDRWMTKELPSTGKGNKGRGRAMDEEIRRRAAARPRRGKRPVAGSGFAHIGDLFRRKRRCRLRNIDALSTVPILNYTPRHPPATQLTGCRL